jgi:hypothetical protein
MLASGKRNTYHLARCAASGGGRPRAPGGPKPKIQELQSAMLGGVLAVDRFPRRRGATHVQ